MIYYISSGHKDGLGGNYRHLIKAQTFAINQGYKFINFCNPEITNSKPFYKSFNIFNDCIKIRDIPEGSSLFIYGDRLRNEVIDRIKQEFPDKNFNYIIDDSLDLYKQINLIDFSQNLREKHQEIFHRRKEQKYNLCFSDYFNIAIHIRRGDVIKKLNDGTKPQYIKRITHDDSYFHLLKKIIPLIPKKYKIILFSEGNIDDFNEYKKRYPNIILNIDKEEWRYLIDEENFSHPEYEIAIRNMKKLIVTCSSSDIFIGSKSHLSIILAYLNKGYSFFENFFSEKNFGKLNKIFLFSDVEKILGKK